MILIFTDGNSVWDAVDTYSKGIIIKASRVRESGSVRVRRLVSSPSDETPYWLIQPRWDGTLENGAPKFGVHNLRVGEDFVLVYLQAPARDGAPWVLNVNQQARILMPAYDPRWDADGL